MGAYLILINYTYSDPNWSNGLESLCYFSIYKSNTHPIEPPVIEPVLRCHCWALPICHSAATTCLPAFSYCSFLWRLFLFFLPASMVYYHILKLKFLSLLEPFYIISDELIGSKFLDPHWDMSYTSLWWKCTAINFFLFGTTWQIYSWEWFYPLYSSLLFLECEARWE